MRGLVLLMLCLAVYYAVALRLTGLQVGISVGILTGLFVIIPYLGFGVGLLLAVLAGFLQFGLTAPFFAVLAVYAVGQLLESYVLTPRLVGERIGLSPVAVIVALLIFSTLFGFVGMLLALPASATLVVVSRFVKQAYFDSAFYQKEAE
jgi:predicted PurR-regulated permease PerM